MKMEKHEMKVNKSHKQRSKTRNEEGDTERY